MKLIDAHKLETKATKLLFPTTMEPCGYLPYPVDAVCVSEIHAMPTIDPIHAAGACYCMECRYCGAPAFTDGVLLCRRGNKPERKNRDDFCSCGKLKGGENDGD